VSENKIPPICDVLQTGGFSFFISFSVVLLYEKNEWLAISVILEGFFIFVILDNINDG
jgi:hypothetical protein